MLNEMDLFTLGVYFVFMNYECLLSFTEEKISRFRSYTDESVSTVVSRVPILHTSI